MSRQFGKFITRLKLMAPAIPRMYREWDVLVAVAKDLWERLTSEVMEIFPRAWALCVAQPSAAVEVGSSYAAAGTAAVFALRQSYWLAAYFALFAFFQFGCVVWSGPKWRGLSCMIGAITWSVTAVLLAFYNGWRSIPLQPFLITFWWMLLSGHIANYNAHRLSNGR